MSDGDSGNGAARARDEKLLIDYVLGRCEGASCEAVRARLVEDAAFAALHADVANTLGALGAWTAPEPPEDIDQRTLQRVQALRRTEALVAAQPAGGDVHRPVFSFRELAALAATVLVAVGILVPSMRRAQQLARRGLCSANIGQIGAALGHFAAGNDDLLPATPAKAEWWLPRPDGQHTSNTEGLFRLVRQRLAAPEAFQCPAVAGQTFVVQAGMTDFPSPRSVAYSYQHSLNAHIRYSRLHVEMVLLADGTPVFAGGRFCPDRVGRSVSDNHGGSGQNVLYPGGRVEWVTHGRVGVDGNNIFLVEGVLNYVGREKPASPTDTFLLPHPGGPFVRPRR